MRKRGLRVFLLALVFLMPGCMSGEMCELREAGLRPEQQKRQGRLQSQGDGTCLDKSTGKLWQMTRSGRIHSLVEARKYSGDLCLAGQCDWRLPSLAELYELFLLFEQYGSVECPMNFDGSYWSGDVDQKGRVGAWELDGDCHPEREYVPKKAGYVRAVRP